MEQVRMAVIGAGYWGPHLIRNVSELPEAQMDMVVDLSLERLRVLQVRYPGVHMTQQFSEALGDNIDAVVLATPVKTHYALARRALQAGKHVLIEKPLTQRSCQALELVHLADRQGVVLMVGHTFEYNPAVVSLREIVQRGDIGDVLYDWLPDLQLDEVERMSLCA